MTPNPWLPSPKESKTKELHFSVLLKAIISVLSRCTFGQRKQKSKSLSPSRLVGQSVFPVSSMWKHIHANSYRLTAITFDVLSLQFASTGTPVTSRILVYTSHLVERKTLILFSPMNTVTFFKSPYRPRRKAKDLASPSWTHRAAQKWMIGFRVWYQYFWYIERSWW